MDAVPLHLAGTRLLADPSGALYVPEAKALLVADLHLEKASAFAAAGAMLPPYDTRQTLLNLERVVRRYRPTTVYCLGDSFHDNDGAARVGALDAARLERLSKDRGWVWIVGNHDAELVPPWGRRAAGDVVIGSLVLLHEAERGGKLPSGEISGHYHPKASLRARGRRIAGRCFVTDGRRLIMPAFGALTGGLNVTDAAIASLLDIRFQALILHRGKLIAVSGARLERA